jgi:hypothetical protein
MRQKIELFKEAVFDFEFCVKKSNEMILSSFPEKLPPLIAYTKKIIPKNGEIKDGEFFLKFSFHGRGCRCQLNGAIVDFDYFGDNFEYNGFEQWKLFQFVKSLRKYYDIQNEDFFNELFRELVEKKVLLRSSSKHLVYRLRNEE